MPQEPTVFLEEPLERTASRATVKPDRNFVDRLPQLRLEDEEKRSRVILLINGHRSGIDFTDVIVHVGEFVDEVSYRGYVSCLFPEVDGLSYAGSSCSRNGNPPLQRCSTLKPSARPVSPNSRSREPSGRIDHGRWPIRCQRTARGPQPYTINSVAWLRTTTKPKRPQLADEFNSVRQFEFSILCGDGLYNGRAQSGV